MKLQAKVTLGSMLLAIIIVVLVSGVDVGSFMDFQLQSTLERAAGIKDVAKDAVIETLNRRHDVSLREDAARSGAQTKAGESDRLTQRCPLH